MNRLQRLSGDRWKNIKPVNMILRQSERQKLRVPV